MPARNIAGQVSDRHGIPLLHALRLDVDSLETGVPDSDDTVLAVLDGVLSLVDVNDLPSGSGGEVNTASNVGAGAEVFKQKTGVDLEFRTLLGSASIDISQAANELTFSVIGAGVTGIDHGNLSGLGDDDHTQYLLANGTRALTGNWAAGAFSIGLNTATPDRRLDILDITNPQLRLTHTDSSRYTDLQAHNDATYGGLSILPATNASSLNVVTLFGLTETTGLTFLDDPGSAALWMRTTQAKDILYHTAATNAHKFQLGFADRFWIQDSLITFFVASKYAFFQASTNTVGVPLLINLQSTGGAGADGIGAGIQWEIEDSSSVANLQAQWDVVLDDADVGTGRDSSSRFRQQVAGVLTEILRVGGGFAGVRIQDGVAGAPAATLDVRGSAIFNEDGNAVDFRVESDTLTHAIFVSSTNNDISIGSAGLTGQGFMLNVLTSMQIQSVGRAIFNIQDVVNSQNLRINCGNNGTAPIDFLFSNDGGTTTLHRIRSDVNSTGNLLISANITGSGIVNVQTKTLFDGEIEIDGALNHDGTTVGFYGATPVTQQTYTASNVTTDRSYDANATTVDELADVVGTLIADLRAVGLVL